MIGAGNKVDVPGRRLEQNLEADGMFHHPAGNFHTGGSEKTNFWRGQWT